MMRLGLSSWTYGWATGVAGYPQPFSPLTALDVLDRARDFGLDLVQLADNLSLHKLPPVAQRELRSRAGDMGIEIELGTRGVQPDHLLRYLDLAGFYGAGLIRTLTHTADCQPNLALAEEWIRSVLDQFRAAGVALALENYERHTSAELADLVRRIGDPHVGICLDTANSLGNLEPLSEVVNLLGPYVLNVHVKAYRIRRVSYMMGYEIIGCPAGDGGLDIAWLLRELCGRGKTPHIILEQWVPYMGSVEESVLVEREWAERSVQFLKRCLC